VNDADNLVLEIAETRGAGKALAALLKLAARLGAALFQRGGDNSDRRQPEAFLVGDPFAQRGDFRPSRARSLPRFGAATGAARAGRAGSLGRSRFHHRALSIRARAPILGKGWDQRAAARASMASQIAAARSGPPRRLMTRRPVGEVTLISGQMPVDHVDADEQQGRDA